MRVLLVLLAQDDADLPPTDQPRQPLLAVAQWHVPKVLAVELEKVEGVQHSLADGAAAVERVEDRDAIRIGYIRLRSISNCRGSSEPDSSRSAISKSCPSRGLTDGPETADIRVDPRQRQWALGLASVTSAWACSSAVIDDRLAGCGLPRATRRARPVAGRAGQPGAGAVALAVT
jgi:hypothetical protein